MLIISPIQPPIGGISIHVQRLMQLLKNDIDFDLIDYSKEIKDNVYNIRQWNIHKYLKILNASDLWYIHAGNRSIAKLHIILSLLLNKKTIITIHGFGNTKAQKIGFVTDFLFQFANQLILVNNDIFKQKNKLGKKSIVIPAFLPPEFDLEPKLPDWLTQYVQINKTDGKIILVANASKLYTENKDVYGLDILFTLADNFYRESQPYLILLVISDLINENNLNKYDLSKINKSIKIIHGQISFVRLMELSDAVLRPTRTDGDSITVREALYLGKPVFASDVVRRPIGTILFKNNDVTDLKNRIQYYFSYNKSIKKETDTNNLNQTFRRKYLSVIKNVIDKKQ